MNLIKIKNIIFWLIGIYVALFTLASQRYEYRIDKIENRANSIINQTSSKNALERIPRVQQMLCPYKPEFWNFYSTFLSILTDSYRYKEIVDLLKEIIEDRKGDLENINLTGIDLSNSNLKNSRLANSILKKSILDFAILDGSSLENVTFELANAHSASFINCVLNNSIFNDSNISSAIFNNSTIKSGNFIQTNAQETSFKKCDLDNSEFINANLRKCIFDESSLTSAKFSNSTIDNSSFQQCNLINVNFDGTKLDGVNFNNATISDFALLKYDFNNAIIERLIILAQYQNIKTLKQKYKKTTMNFITDKDSYPGADLSNLYFYKKNFDAHKLMDVNFTNSDLSYASIYGSWLDNANFTNATLINANLTSSNMIGVKMFGANISGAVLDNADLRKAQGLTPEQICSANSLKNTMLDDELKELVQKKCPEFFK